MLTNVFKHSGHSNRKSDGSGGKSIVDLLPTVFAEYAINVPELLLFTPVDVDRYWLL